MNNDKSVREQKLERLRQLLLEGMQSELSDKPLDKAYFDSMRKRAREYEGRQQEIRTAKATKRDE